MHDPLWTPCVLAVINLCSLGFKLRISWVYLPSQQGIWFCWGELRQWWSGPLLPWRLGRGRWFSGRELWKGGSLAVLVKTQYGNPRWQWKISSRWFSCYGEKVHDFVTKNSPCQTPTMLFFYRHGFRRCTGTQPVGQKCTKWMVLPFEGWNRRPWWSSGYSCPFDLCWAAQQEIPAVSQGLPCFSSGLRTAWGGESLWVPERCGDLSWVWHEVFVARASPEKIIYSP